MASPLFMKRFGFWFFQLIALNKIYKKASNDRYVTFTVYTLQAKKPSLREFPTFACAFAFSLYNLIYQSLLWLQLSKFCNCTLGYQCRHKVIILVIWGHRACVGPLMSIHHKLPISRFFSNIFAFWLFHVVAVAISFKTLCCRPAVTVTVFVLKAPPLCKNVISAVTLQLVKINHWIWCLGVCFWGHRRR